MPVASGVVNRFDSVMTSLCGLPFERLHVEKAFAAGAAGLVDDDHRLLHQVVLGDDALDDARHLVGAAAGAGRHDEFHRPRRLPGRCGRVSQNQRRLRPPAATAATPWVANSQSMTWACHALSPQKNRLPSPPDFVAGLGDTSRKFSVPMGQRPSRKQIIKYAKSQD